MTHAFTPANGWTISGYTPGSLADVVKLHADYYAREWDFGLAFETKVATELAEFLSRFDPDKHLFLNVSRNGHLAGTISIDGDDPDGAHLRWFITSDAARGTGLGRWLMQQAITFSRSLNVPKIWLTTFAGLDAAAHLYTSTGFKMINETAQDQWKGGVTERRYELQF